jgi:glucokinase
VVRQEQVQQSGACVVTLDVGGTTIKGALVRADGRESHHTTVRTPVERGPDAVVGCVRDVARGLAEVGHSGDGVVGAGVCVPGIVDTGAGVARWAGNLGWKDVLLRDLLTADLAVPVVVENDVRAATVAEMAVGLGQDVADLAVIVLGTGVAAGLVVGGVPVHGAAGMAGEFGHLPVHPGGELCACGQHGCLEVYASAAAIARRYAATAAPGASAEPVSAREVLSRAESDPVAARIWADATDALGLALASCTLLLDPQLVVLAGGLSQAGLALLQPVRAATQAALAWRSAPAIEISPLGARAGRVGAAIIAWRAAGAGALVTSWPAPQPGAPPSRAPDTGAHR